MEEEKRRSGVKTQMRREGMGVSWDSSGGAAVWMWNLRRPVFSMRWRRRTDIHFWTVCVVGEDEVVFADRMLMAHFCIRQPSVVGSWAPIVWLQCLHWIRSWSVPSGEEESCVMLAYARLNDESQQCM